MTLEGEIAVDTRTDVQKKFDKLEGMACFACAPKHRNPLGLNLVFEETPNGAKTRFCLAPQFQSYPGFLHGGIVSAILDETMAYAGVFKRNVLPFTKSMKIYFRRGVRADLFHDCVASITKSEGRYFETEGAILDSRGVALVTASAEFTVPNLAMISKMMPHTHIEPFKEFFPDL